MIRTTRRSVLLMGATALGTAADNAVDLTIESPGPQVQFAAGEIRRELAANRIALRKNAPTRIHLRVTPRAGADEQAYSIRKTAEGHHTIYTATGAGPVGAMYAGLDIAEAIRLGTLAELDNIDRTPYIAKRGIKFNIPLDSRTPSYSDAADSAQQNIPEMWSMEFWCEFLDELARDRYNVLSLWNLHPFPSMVKVPEYPDVALADVMRTTVRFEDQHHNGTEMGSPEIFSHLETIRKMTIEEKIRFWRDVMQYAHDRGIEVLLFTWNIFTWGADGKHGITWDQTNPTTIDYFRRSVRETILTYPLLAGIGITAGEHMPVNSGEFAREKWLWKAYGEGVRDAMKAQPDRRFRLIHRQHQTSLQKILEEWKDLPCTFEMSYKYSVAHMYSDPKPQFARKDILGEMPRGLRVWMTVRNDDIYSFRWGDPEYARAYVRNLPGADQLAGFYMGPDGYTWGREFVSTEPEKPHQLVIKKQWYSFMLWGRLSYDPTLPDAHFERTLARRFPEVNAAKLYAACARASKIIPRATTFSWGDIGVKWFPEGCTGHPNGRGFYTVEKFMHGESMPGSGVLSIPDFLKGKPGMTPQQVADELKANAAAALDLIAGLHPVKNKELRLTLGDCEAMAHLGNYYAEKILGATDLALFDRDGKPAPKDSSVAHLRAALEHWKRYAAVATAQYKPQLLTRIGWFDLNQLTAKVEHDVALAEGWKRQSNS
jgi:hypothetical protein